MPTLDLLYKCEQGEQIIDFDVDDRGRLTIIQQKGLITQLIAGGEVWAVWKSADRPHARHVRWLTNDRVILWSFPTDKSEVNAVRTVGRGSIAVLPIGSPFRIFTGDNLLYCCYGEDRTSAATPGDIEFQIVAARALDGRLILGLGNEIDKISYSGVPLELSVGCVTEDGRLVFLLYDTEGVWSMDPAKLKINCMPFINMKAQTLAISALEGRLFFVWKKASNISFGSYDLDAGVISDLDIFPLTEVLSKIHTTDSLQHSRPSIHGTRDGGMAISAGGSVWRLGLDR